LRGEWIAKIFFARSVFACIDDWLCRGSRRTGMLVVKPLLKVSPAWPFDNTNSLGRHDGKKIMVVE